VSDYLPLCAFRQGLLPPPCRSCAWWQTTGREPLGPSQATEKRRQWMAVVDKSWGPTGVLLVGHEFVSRLRAVPPGRRSGTPSSPREAIATPRIVASINFAPPAVIPRLRELPFGPLPSNSAFLFCLMVEEEQSRIAHRRVLHKALALLQAQGIEQVFAVGGATAKEKEQTDCHFFGVEFLQTNGFETVSEAGTLRLMRIEMRSLLSLVRQLQYVVRRVLGQSEPAPTPVAWSRRET
jgi:hypothetical protein